ncbi:MAG: hypothetical protein K9I95_14130 [Flavobacteriaceae bacterium]|nr:hypothetical protein [Flavobacteriaceae bacterium]
MIEQILESPDFPSSFNIEEQKKRYNKDYEKDYGQLPNFLINKNQISKSEVIELIRNKKYNNKTEFLAILFWGVFFLSAKKNAKNSLLKFINSGIFDDFMNFAKKEIIDSDSPSDLFKKFSKRYKDPKTKKHKIPGKTEFKDGIEAFKIPGIDYPYFTKLFFFYREALVPKKQTYLILDKWLSMAWCAIDGTINNNTLVYDSYYRCNGGKNKNLFDGTLKRKKPLAYESYIKYMQKLALENKINVIELEEKLFGTDRTVSKKNNLYNPRNEYTEWGLTKGLKLSKKAKKEKLIKTETSQNKVSKKNKSNNNIQRENNIPLTRNQPNVINSNVPKPPFHPIKKKEYRGLYIKKDSKKKGEKVGYVDFKGWLCASEDLKKLLGSHELNWEEGNTKSGTKEKYKTKFPTHDECIQFLIDKNIIYPLED